jgi:hypothetical protein
MAVHRSNQARVDSFSGVTSGKEATVTELRSGGRIDSESGGGYFQITNGHSGNSYLNQNGKGHPGNFNPGSGGDRKDPPHLGKLKFGGRAFPHFLALRRFNAKRELCPSRMADLGC